MQKLRQFMYALPLMLLIVGFGPSAAVLAQHGTDDTTQTTANADGSTTTETEHTTTTQTSGGVKSGSGSGGGTSGRTALRTSTRETETQEASDDKGLHTESELHQKGVTLLDDLRKEHNSNLSEDQRKHRCEQHKDGLETKFGRISDNAATLQTRIDDIFTKAMAYQQTHNLQVTDWDTLVAAANAAKTTATQSVANLQSLTPAVDCTSGSVAENIATFKVAAQETRDNLKAYKATVKAVLKALQTAKENEGSNSNV